MNSHEYHPEHIGLCAAMLERRVDLIIVDDSPIESHQNRWYVWLERICMQLISPNLA